MLSSSYAFSLITHLVVLMRVCAVQVKQVLDPDVFQEFAANIKASKRFTPNKLV